MQIKQVDGKWLAKKSNKAKRWEDVTDIIEFQGDDFCSVMGKAGRTKFHTYLGKSGGRWLQFHGVTSLLGYWGDKKSLEEYIKRNTVVGAYLNNVTSDELEVIKSMIPEDGNVTKDAEKAISKQFPQFRTAMKYTDSILNDTSDWGKKVHAEVEEYIKKAISYGGRLTAVPEGSEQFQLFVKWAIENDVQFIASEKVVYSRKLWSAGTLDFMCRINGKLCIGDIKTNNWLSIKHFFQCGGYAEMIEDKIEGIVVVNLPRTGGIKVAVNEPLGIEADYTLHMPVEKLRNAFKSIVELVKIDKDVSSVLYSVLYS